MLNEAEEGEELKANRSERSSFSKLADEREARYLSRRVKCREEVREEKVTVFER